jgi:hypothetical protein
VEAKFCEIEALWMSELILNPPYTQEMMSEEAQLELGFIISGINQLSEASND